METFKENFIKEAEQKINSLKFLNKLWEKSKHSEEDYAEFLRVQISMIEDILKTLIPVYAELINKDELTDKEAWILKFIQDAFGQLLFSLTHSMYMQIYISLCELKLIPKELGEKAYKLHNFLAELMGYYNEDKNLDKQIEQSLEDIKTGNVVSMEEIFKETKI